MPTKKLILKLPNPVPYYRKVVEGMGEYLADHPEWEVMWEGDNLFWNGAEAWTSGADAIICGVLSAEDEARREAFGGRLITISNRRLQPGIDMVVSDDREVGREAGRHLAGQGFRRLVFINFTRGHFSAERYAGAREIFGGYADSQVASFSLETLSQMPDLVGKIREQFRPPFAIYCDNDVPAVMLAGIAGRVGLRIPEDAALLGTDNSSLLCAFCRPRLSSVALNLRRISHCLVEALTREERQEPGSTRIAVPPLGVVTRASTDIAAVEDRRIAKALVYMRAEKGRGMTVAEVARIAGMSQRLLEMKFKQLLHRSPYQEMLRLRVDHAKDLLRRTDWDIGPVAERSGFDDIRSFNHAFRKRVGASPREYRKSVR